MVLPSEVLIFFILTFRIYARIMWDDFYAGVRTSWDVPRRLVDFLTS